MNSITNFIAGVLFSLASFFGYQTPVQQPVTLGAVYPVGGTTFYLAGSGVTSSASSVTLTSFQTPDGRNLTMSMFGTIGYGAFEPGSSKLEDVTFTGITQNANGTATLTGVTRGNDFITPYSASTTLAKAHAGGVPFVLSNTPGFYTQFMPVNNTATSTAVMFFSSTTPPRYDFTAAQSTGTYIATTSEFASVAYVNAVALTSAPNGTTAVKGVYQTATGLQAASSTATGSTGAQLVLANGIATDTPSVPQSVSGSKVIMSNILGFLNQAWIDLSANFTFTGGLTSTATTTLAGSNVLSNAVKINTVPYSFPSTQGFLGAIWRNDGSGNMSWGGAPKYNYATTTESTVTGTYSTTTPFVIPSGIISASSTVQWVIDARVDGNGGTGLCQFWLKDTNNNIYSVLSSPTIGSGQGAETTVSGTMMSNNSSSAQITTSRLVSVVGGTIASTVAGGINRSATATSVNMSGGVSFIGVMFGTSGAAVCTIHDMMMFVNP